MNNQCILHSYVYAQTLILAATKIHSSKNVDPAVLQVQDSCICNLGKSLGLSIPKH